MIWRMEEEGSDLEKKKKKKKKKKKGLENSSNCKNSSLSSTWIFSSTLDYHHL